MSVFCITFTYVIFYQAKTEHYTCKKKKLELPGNRKIHSIRLNQDNTKLLVNSRSCYCLNYIDEDYMNCQNKLHKDDWHEHEIELLTEPSVKVTRSELEPEPDAERVKSNADLVVMGTIVAVAANSDPNYDYYLIKVTVNEPVMLEEDVVDDYGCPMVFRSRVLKGNFLVKKICLPRRIA